MCHIDSEIICTKSFLSYICMNVPLHAGPNNPSTHDLILTSNMNQMETVVRIAVLYKVSNHDMGGQSTIITSHLQPPSITELVFFTEKTSRKQKRRGHKQQGGVERWPRATLHLLHTGTWQTYRQISQKGEIVPTAIHLPCLAFYSTSTRSIFSQNNHFISSPP
jgi:hypothetical protein